MKDPLRQFSARKLAGEFWVRMIVFGKEFHQREYEPSQKKFIPDPAKIGLRIHVSLPRFSFSEFTLSFTRSSFSAYSL
jgi:hypothetical protein